MVGLITLLLILPRVIASPVTGLLADTMDRRRLMMIGMMARFALVALIPLTSQIWQIAVLTVGLSIGNAISRPAEMSALPAVSGGELLVRALSLLQVTNGVIRIAVPAAGAALIAVSGPKAIFWLQAVAFALAALAIRRLEVPGTGKQTSLRTILGSAKSEMWAGIHAVKAVPIVRGITATEALFQLVPGATVVAAIVYTEETLHLGNRAESAFALMSAAASAGAVAGALIASRIEFRIGRRKMMAVGYLGPLFLTIATVSPPMPVIYVSGIPGRVDPRRHARTGLCRLGSAGFAGRLARLSGGRLYHAHPWRTGHIRRDRSAGRHRWTVPPLENRSARFNPPSCPCGRPGRFLTVVSLNRQLIPARPVRWRLPDGGHRA
jgi:MFS family permease